MNEEKKQIEWNSIAEYLGFSLMESTIYEMYQARWLSS